MLLRTIAEHLGPSVTEDQDYFDLGGDSLLAAEITMTASEALGSSVDLQAVYMSTSIGEILDRLCASSLAERPDLGLALNLLSTNEERALLSGGLLADAPLVVSGVLQLTGSFEEARLREAFERLALRHEALRTTYEWPSHTPRRINVQPVLQVEVDRDEVEVDSKARAAWIQTGEAKVMDRARGPLAGLRIRTAGHDRALIHLWCDHIICDGHSMDLLLRELVTLYDGRSPSAIPGSLKTWVQNEREFEGGSAAKLLLDDWAELLGLSEDVLIFEPRSEGSESEEGPSGAEVWLNLKQLQLARALPAKEGRTLAEHIANCYASELFEYTDSDSLFMIVPVSNRGTVEATNTVGWIAHNCFVRADRGSLGATTSLRYSLGLSRVSNGLIRQHLWKNTYGRYRAAPGCFLSIVEARAGNVGPDKRWETLDLPAGESTPGIELWVTIFSGGLRLRVASDGTFKAAAVDDICRRVKARLCGWNGSR